MIQRFRNKAKELKLKYIFTELFLIVVGINVGLWFNNLNESRKAHNLEQKMLQELKMSLLSDQADMVQNLKVHKESVEACDSVLSKNEVKADQLFSTLGWTYLIADLSAYESLKSIGFQLISDDHIRRRMIKLYNVHYKTVYENEKNHKTKRDHIEKELFSMVIREDSVFKMQEDIFTKKPNLTFDIAVLRESNERMAVLYENEVLPEIDTLLNKIHGQLNGP